jgi:hypothetical protein
MSMETSQRRTVAVIGKIVSYLALFWAIANIIILSIGFVLLLFGANPTAGFTQWAYRNLDRVMYPFRGIFEPVDVGTVGSGVEAVFESSIVFAMIVYLIVILVLQSLVNWILYRIQLLDRRMELEALDAEAARQGLAYGSDGPATGGYVAPGGPGAPLA